MSVVVAVMSGDFSDTVAPSRQYLEPTSKEAFLVRGAAGWVLCGGADAYLPNTWLLDANINRGTSFTTAACHEASLR